MLVAILDRRGLALAAALAGESDLGADGRRLGFELFADARVPAGDFEGDGGLEFRKLRIVKRHDVSRCINS